MLVEIETIISEHEVIYKQTTGNETAYIIIPKKQAVNIARKILKAYPKETISQIIDDLTEKK